MSDQSNEIDAFAAFAKQIEENQKSQENRSSYKSKSYEDIAWVGLEPNAWRIVRFIGNPPETLTPGYKASETDALELYISDIKTDKGKYMQLKLPVRGDMPEKDFIIWRIIDKVMETEYQNKKRVYKWENDPNTQIVFNKVAHGGWDPVKEAMKFKFSRGWAGQKVCVVNVIDREDMEWHRANKHTKLLSRQVTTSINDKGETVYYSKVGVPSYGFVDIIGGLVANYGNWNNYDFGIKRTGQKNSPYQIHNASAHKNGGLKEIPENVLKLASVEPLTEEEKSWKKYDIGKIYKPTSYNKLKSSLGETIKSIDYVFNTHFYEELDQLAAKETEEWKALEAENQTATETDNSDIDEIFGAPKPASVELSESTTTPTPVRQAAAPVATIATNEKLSPEVLSSLKGYQYLTDEQKNQIMDVQFDTDGNIVDIKYNTNEQVVACPACKAPGLMAHTHCLACGMKFD